MFVLPVFDFNFVANNLEKRRELRRNMFLREPLPTPWKKNYE